MSRDPHFYEYPAYYKSSRPNLPPIRDVFGDVLEQPVRCRPDNSDAYSSRRHTQNAHPRRYTEPHLPPLRSRSADNTPQHSSQTVSLPRAAASYPQLHYSQKSHAKAPSRGPEPLKHSYDVFVPSNQGLIHQRSSTKDDFRQSAKEEAISTSTGKHACAECGRRFEKLSHFKNHMNSHSGEKPYQCPWPGCRKTFSASSNMRRHERTHVNADDARKK